MTEEERLREARVRTAHWKRWGPYLSERAWGTVREDYSPDGAAWDYLSHDAARSKAYRWNEDGIAGISDRHQLICFGLTLWNERDPILKERLFGLSGSEGNHGEDVKEQYFYLDNTPTHSYMKFLYKYPQAAFPYAELVAENQRRGRSGPEFELLETGVFADSRYFDVFIEYAKAAPDDILIKITAVNRGPESAPLHLLPTLWFRNTWAWGQPGLRPELSRAPASDHAETIKAVHSYYGPRWLHCEGQPKLLFTENETNAQRLYGFVNAVPYVKDGINEAIVEGRAEAVNPDERGTKAAADYHFVLGPGETATVRLRLTDADVLPNASTVFADFDDIFAIRRAEADQFYAQVIPPDLSEDARQVMRQAFAGLLWSKQFYHYVLEQWLAGDPGQPNPPDRRTGRNGEWTHLFNADVLSMPDKWEYPWYAAWDLAFHCLPLVLIDSEFAKEQLTLMLREWYMHPNGQLPAYEWEFGDVNPPVHAWAAWRVYKIEKKRHGPDRQFLERVFHKLTINFTWWVNRKDAEGKNVFQGGFLGLDNIGIFDRSAPLPTGGNIQQADGTSWMGMYCLNMMTIALELAKENPVYEDVASKFWEHFVRIAYAMNNLGHHGIRIWDEEDGFYYDVLQRPDGTATPLKVRSMVGLIPLFAVETLEPKVLNRMFQFKRRMDWFINNRPDLTGDLPCMSIPGLGERRLLAIVDPDRLRRVLRIMLDEDEFLSPYGIRALSRCHKDAPYTLEVEGREYRVGYEPAESKTELFGGNSNWRGPIWLPVNYLLIESLQKYHHYLGDDYTVECPTGSGQWMTLWEVAAELSERLNRLFLQDENGHRPAHGGDSVFADDPHWRDLVLFYEYFHGDTGAGLGANHQTGWTGLVAKLLQQTGIGPGRPSSDWTPERRTE